MPREEVHSNSRRYVPAGKKDHNRDLQLHNYNEHTNEGMDTNTHTSRYVPAGGGFLGGLFRKKGSK